MKVDSAWALAPQKPPRPTPRPLHAIDPSSPLLHQMLLAVLGSPLRWKWQLATPLPPRSLHFIYSACDGLRRCSDRQFRPRFVSAASTLDKWRNTDHQMDWSLERDTVGGAVSVGSWDKPSADSSSASTGGCCESGLNRAIRQEPS